MRTELINCLPPPPPFKIFGSATEWNLGYTILVNNAGVIDVFSLYTRSTIVGLTCCYQAVVWLSKVYSYTVLCSIVYDDDYTQAYPVALGRI